jgi:hypothetical protein
MGFLPIFSQRRAPAIFATLTLLALASSVRAESLGVEGRVVLRESPVSEARVYAYQLVEKSLHKVLTDDSGRFLFESLPAGIYKLVAHKAGLQPAVLLLQRDAAENPQFVELVLTEQTAPEVTNFWTVRSEIPGDVLRDLEGMSEVEASSPSQLASLKLGSETTLDSRLLTEVSATGGVHDVTPTTSARVAGANVGLRGQLGKVKLSMEGDFQSFESDFQGKFDAKVIDGQTHSVSLNLQTPGQGDFDISSSSNRLVMDDERLSAPVESSQLLFRWNRPLGENGTTSVRASLIEESGLYNRAWIDPLGIPLSSRTLQLEGDYSRKIADHGDLRAGLRYRESTGAYARRAPGTSAALPDSQSLDAFSDGGWQVSSRVLVQYGLFSTLTDGNVSLTPRGGFVLQMSPHWQASVAASHRVIAKDETLTADILPMVLDETLSCGEAETSCYQVGFNRASGVDDQISFGGSYRELDDTIRMYFNGSFLDSSEGIFLVAGDRLPEAHASVRQRLSPGIVTKVSASVASGGGGVYRSVNRRYFQNKVSMLSSAIDTTFEKTSTGVYLSFHRLDQELQPLRRTQPVAENPAADLERLDLVVSQDLSAIWDLSLNWAVQLGMGLARGASFYHSEVDPEAIQRRVTTAVAVRF